MSIVQNRSPRAPAPAVTAPDAELCERAIFCAKPIDTWPPDALRRLAAASRVRRYRRGARLVSGGEPLQAALLIASGDVEVSFSSADGRQFTYALGASGAIFGLLPLLDGRGMPHDLNALDAVTAVAIPFSAIRAELAARPALWESLALDMAWRFRNLFNIVHGHVLEPASVRLANVLVRLAQAEGETAPEGVAIRVRLSQARLGELVGVTRQTAMQLVHDLEARGLVAWRYGRAVVRDLPGLQALGSNQPVTPGTPPAAR
jgi:CRP/FNR family transcriptional regulator, cyclic AMP receptor protein